MNNLYLLLNISSVIVPFIASFHPRLKFYKKWKSLFISMIIVNIIFILWDIWFTKIGVWGFNPDYLIGINLLNLPIEEWMFFITIPYACVFMHYSLEAIYPKMAINKKVSTRITYVLLVLFTLLVIFNYDKWYTLINYTLGTIILLLVHKKQPELLSKFYISFLLMLIPFFIINGILTGSGIQDQVVWYNNKENLGVRMFTIPFEDATYALTLILSNIFIIERLRFFKK